MASITVRNLDDSLKQRLKEQAAKHGCSMEEEVRRILEDALNLQLATDAPKGKDTPQTGLDLAMAIHESFQSVGLTDEESELFFRSIEELRHPDRYKPKQVDGSESR